MLISLKKCSELLFSKWTILQILKQFLWTALLTGAQCTLRIYQTEFFFLALFFRGRQVYKHWSLFIFIKLFPSSLLIYRGSSRWFLVSHFLNQFHTFSGTMAKWANYWIDRFFSFEQYLAPLFHSIFRRGKCCIGVGNVIMWMLIPFLFFSLKTTDSQ